MKSHLVHQLVHNERCAGHIATVFHKGDEKIENQDVRQEDDDGAYAGYDAVGQQRAQWTFGHIVGHQLAQPSEEGVDPVHRVGAKGEGAVEGDEHKDEKHRIAEPAVGDDGIDAVGVFVECALLVLGVAFCQRAAHKGILGVGDGALDVLRLLFHCHLMAFAYVFVHESASNLFLELVGNLVAHFDDAAVGVALVGVLLQLLVVLQQFDGQETGGEAVAEAVFIELGAELLDAAFQFAAVVDVDVSCRGVAAFVDLYDFVEEAVYAVAAASCGWHYGHTQQCGELSDVEPVAATLQFVIHIQGHHHRYVHIYELCGEV